MRACKVALNRTSGLTIKLVRHAESEANCGELKMPHEHADYAVKLSQAGEMQALEAGAVIGRRFIRGALVYSSPYRRTRQTLEGIIMGAGMRRDDVRVMEDPRLREVELGYAEWEGQEQKRKVHGRFYYRFQGGESPADCYDRTSSFLESMMRQVERHKSERVLIVSHGLTIRCFIMRFLHMTVEEFDTMLNLHNCGVVTLSNEIAAFADNPVDLVRGKWGVSGLRFQGNVTQHLH